MEIMYPQKELVSRRLVQTAVRADPAMSHQKRLRGHSKCCWQRIPLAKSTELGFEVRPESLSRSRKRQDAYSMLRNDA